mmetsp:Transcript_591/g.1334  ORF Transcript_591/g.1334 Transcript_591/m.1334 type:complete len:276 (-) Transcript_591:1298-2125(-)
MPSGHLSQCLQMFPCLPIGLAQGNLIGGEAEQRHGIPPLVGGSAAVLLQAQGSGPSLGRFGASCEAVSQTAPGAGSRPCWGTLRLEKERGQQQLQIRTVSPCIPLWELIPLAARMGHLRMCPTAHMSSHLPQPRPSSGSCVTAPAQCLRSRRPHCRRPDRPPPRPRCRCFRATSPAPSRCPRHSRPRQRAYPPPRPPRLRALRPRRRCRPPQRSQTPRRRAPSSPAPACPRAARPRPQMTLAAPLCLRPPRAGCCSPPPLLAPGWQEPCRRSRAP